MPLLPSLAFFYLPSLCEKLLTRAPKPDKLGISKGHYLKVS